MPTFSMLTFVFAGLAAFACATGTGTKGTNAVQAPDSGPIVAELRAQNGVYVRRIADLEDRVLFLENELARARGAAPIPPWAGRADTAKSRVQSGTNSARPATAIGGTHAESAPLAADVAGGGAADVGDSSVVGVHDVEYEGDAALRSKARRPVLRLRPEKRDEAPTKRR